MYHFDLQITSLRHVQLRKRVSDALMQCGTVHLCSITMGCSSNGSYWYTWRTHQPKQSQPDMSTHSCQQYWCRSDRSCVIPTRTHLHLSLENTCINTDNFKDATITFSSMQGTSLSNDEARFTLSPVQQVTHKHVGQLHANTYILRSTATNAKHRYPTNDSFGGCVYKCSVLVDIKNAS